MRFFDLGEIREARAWVQEGGIAIHRNFDLKGQMVGGKARKGVAWHVLGPEEALLEWGRANGLSARWLQHPGNPARVHWDVFGALARQLEKEAQEVKAAVVVTEEGQGSLKLD